VTAPFDSILKYLYSKAVPAGRETAVYHKGSELVYLLAESGTAEDEEVDQLPSCAIEPVKYTFSPKVVTSLRSNVMLTLVAVAQDDVVVFVEVVLVVVVVVGFPEPVVVVVVPPEPPVWPDGKEVSVAVLYGPVALVALHTPGTLAAPDSPQEAGTVPARR